MKISRRWTLLAWPGLPQLWLRGAWSGLAIAISCSLIASLLLVGKLVWYEWLPIEIELGGLILLVVAWIGSAIHAETSLLWHELADRSEHAPLPAGQRQKVAAQPETKHRPVGKQANTDPSQTSKTETIASRRMKERKRILAQLDALFVQAQTQYMKGDWLSAEQSLNKVLRHNPRDVEAQLLLATLYRRTKRFQEAKNQLSKLCLLESSSRWEYEIAAENRMLVESKQAFSTLDRTEKIDDEKSGHEKPLKGGPIEKTEAKDTLFDPETRLPLCAIEPPIQQPATTTTIKAA